jgi:hypothetical protein
MNQLSRATGALNNSNIRIYNGYRCYLQVCGPGTISSGVRGLASFPIAGDFSPLLGSLLLFGNGLHEEGSDGTKRDKLTARRPFLPGDFHFAASNP